MTPYMDFTPRRIIGMIREGDRNDVVHSITPWVCASCYSCTVECPKQIPITGIMHALRRIALREKSYPKRFPIPVMEREFVDMVEKRGRSTESWLAVRMYMKTDPMQLVKHASVGQRLMRRGRMGLGLESIRDRAQLRELLRAVEGPPATSGAPASGTPTGPSSRTESAT
jgi:heterodisulfide reductase subunit C